MVSMPLGLRVCLILGATFVLIYIIYSSVKARMNVRYAILWTVWSIVILIFGIWPDLAAKLAEAVGFQSVSNFIFLVMIALLFLFNSYAYLKMSHMANDIRKLNYTVAELRKELEEKKDSHE